jgi:hypothetical protein
MSDLKFDAAISFLSRNGLIAGRCRYMGASQSAGERWALRRDGGLFIGFGCVEHHSLDAAAYAVTGLKGGHDTVAQ